MYYRAELDFFRKTLEKMRIQTILLHYDDLPEEPVDFGLRKFLGNEQEYHQSIRESSRWSRNNTVHKLTDAYFCNYIFFNLPETDPSASLLIGPYMTFQMTGQRIMEEAERFGIPATQVRHLEDYYLNIPVIADDSPLFALIGSLAESMWGSGRAYEIVDLRQEMLTISVPPRTEPDSKDKDDTLLQMKIMETRYAYENELMENVSKGLTQRAERMLLRATREFMKQRIADPLRNLKNYCIISNTLMRKAAEKGGVHPLHLDRTSAAFAAKIESAPNVDAAQALIAEMAHVYCRLVRKQSPKQYSPLIRKVVSHIEAELAGDLSLRNLAAVHNINPSYLSTLFRKETGKTVTEYINERRMETAMQLLSSTRLQIQTIAQHCGMSDANYFAKLFKKQFGQTPKQFRESCDSTLGGR